MSIPQCPTDCEANLPVVEFNECAPEINLSQINKVYLGKRNQPFTDWTDPAEWASRLSNTSLDDDAIRTLIVVGDKPLPEVQEQEISNQRTVVLNRNHSLNLAVDESNGVNHAAIRDLQCTTQLSMWYETLGGKLFGGNDGIPVSLQIGIVLAGGAGDIQKYQGVAKWKSQFDELMIDSPIAA